MNLIMEAEIPALETVDYVVVSDITSSPSGITTIHLAEAQITVDVFHLSHNQQRLYELCNGKSDVESEGSAEAILYQIKTYSLPNVIFNDIWTS